MPYSSDSQRRYFHAAESRGDISHKTVSEFDRASKGRHLPEYVKKWSGGKMARGGRVGGYFAGGPATQNEAEYFEPDFKTEVAAHDPREKYNGHPYAMESEQADLSLMGHDSRERYDGDPYAPEHEERLKKKFAKGGMAFAHALRGRHV